MSLPDELLDELLSGYLDGVLSGDEQARVEQLVRDDSEVHSRLEELRSQINATRKAAWPTPELPKGFSQKVVQAAIERAQQEQLDADHPLILAGQQPADSPAFVRTELASGRRFNSRHVVGIVASVAASLLLISLVVRQNDVTDPVDNTVANVDHTQPTEKNPSGGIKVAQGGGDSNPDVTPDAPGLKPNNSSKGPLKGSDEMIAKVETDGDQKQDLSPTENAPPANMVADSGKKDVPSTVENVSPAENPSPVEAGPMDLVAQSEVPRLSFLMIVEVRLTDVGQQGQAFEDALVSAEITPSQERLVDDQLANLATSKPNQESSNDGAVPKIVFLEAPVKQLDKFVNHLAGDSEGVQRVGFSLIDNADLLQPINAVRVKDPTEVRHEAQSWPIVGQSEQFHGWTSQLGDTGFVPWGSGAQVPRSEGGPNPPGSLLILIR